MSIRGAGVLTVVLAGFLLGCAAGVGVPGETTADLFLQRDVQMVLRGRIVNTEVISIKGTTITERWTVDEDGEEAAWIVVFIPNPPGTDISFQKVKKD